MQISVLVTLLAVVPKEFKSDTGEDVVYSELYFLNKEHTDDGLQKQVFKINTKSKNILANEGEDGVVKLDIDLTGKNKPRFMSFEV